MVLSGRSDSDTEVCIREEQECRPCLKTRTAEHPGNLMWRANPDLACAACDTGDLTNGT